MKALVEFLESPAREEQSVEEVASDIVDAFYNLLLKPLKDAPPTIKVGEPFKSLVTGKVHTPLWEQDDLWWIVTSDSSYGYLGPVEPWQKYAAPTRAAAAKTENKDGWKVDDTVAFLRSKKRATIIAVTEKCALVLHDGADRPVVEPNDSLSKFYTRMKAPVKLF